MRFEAVSPTADLSRHAFASSFRFRSSEMDRHMSLAVLSNPFSPKTLLKSRSLGRISRRKVIQRSCSLNLDGVFDEENSFRVEGPSKKSNNVKEEGIIRKNNKKKLHCATSKNRPFMRKQGRDQGSFLYTRFDFLEPMMLGIRPEFPDLPDHETASWAMIEQKAKSLDMPLSLRMIKKKLQQEEGLVDSNEKESGCCSIKAAFASMVFIIVELQSSALHMREALCGEDLEVVMSKVQKEMHKSFIWLFQQVFLRTPDLMLELMVLLADFGVHSASCNAALGEASLSSALTEQIQQHQQIDISLTSLVSENGNKESIEEKMDVENLPRSLENLSIYREEELESVEEMTLCSSMVDEARKMREGVDDEEVLDNDTMKHFVSPMSVEIEPDRYEEYLRTDLLYQMNLSQEPNNPLLLCNYAQFLHLVVHDNLRAEECFKRAIQITPPDAESLSQYANFLWTVRKDYWAAEEAFLQALSLEPKNSYHASKYADFLWSTGGEETCFPLNNPEGVV